MRRHLIFTALVGLLLVGAAFPAFAAKTSNMSVPAGCNPTTTTGCLGKACDTTGLTVMDIDQKRILACLKNDSGAKVWKVMTQDTECCKEKKTTGGSDGCSDGMTAGFVGGVGGCYITGTPLDVSAPK